VLSASAPSAPSIDIVAVHPDHAVFLAQQDDGDVAVVRTVELPFRWLGTHRWFGRDVAVVGMDEDNVTRVGTITERGFAELRFPATGWPEPLDAKLHDASWSLRSTASGELWLVRCLGYSYLEGKHCLEASYARLLPTSSTPQRLARPPEDRPAYPLEKAAPPEDLRVEMIDDPLAGQPSSARYSTARIPRKKILRCTDARGARSEYPEQEARRMGEDFELSDLVWLSRQPPIFRITQAMQCNGVCYFGVTFEGCTPSERFENAQLATGPDGAFALFTSSLLAVRRRDRELGTLRVSAEQVSFRP
jgi:hypothetical protein